MTRAHRQYRLLARAFGACGLAFSAAWTSTGMAEQNVQVSAVADVCSVVEQLAQEYGRTRPVTFVVEAHGERAHRPAVEVPKNSGSAGPRGDLFFTDDAAEVERLERAGVAVASTRVTYAVGKLVLWMPGLRAGGDLSAALDARTVRTVAVADASDDAYGAAAQQVLRQLPRSARVKVLIAGDVRQAFEWTAAGRAEAGFVSRAQIRDLERTNKRSLAAEVVAVDPAMHTAIELYAVMLAAGQSKAAARDFLQFIASDPAQSIVSAAGYGSPTWIPPNCHACERPSAAGR